MNPPEFYAGQVKQLALAHNEHFRVITADGVINYGEALNTRELLDAYNHRLQEIKREITDDIENLRHTYGERMLVAQQQMSGAERAAELQRIRQAEQRATDHYESLIKRIEFLQVGIPQNQHLIETHIAALENEMNATLDTFPDVQFDDVDHFDPIRNNLTRILKNWHALLENIAQRASESQNPQQNAYDTGVERGLELAIRDIEDVVALMDRLHQENAGTVS